MRQLDLFAADEAELLSEAAEAESAWNATSADGAEEAYGDYQLVVDAIADRLLDIREAYARSLAEHRDKIAVWAQSCPENFHHKHLLDIHSKVIEEEDEEERN